LTVDATTEVITLGNLARDTSYPEALRSRSLFVVWGPPSHGPRTKVFARRLGIEPVFVYSTTRRGLWVGPWKYAYQAVATLLTLLRRRPRVVFVQSPPSFAPVVVWLVSSMLGARFIIDAHSGALDTRVWTRPAWLHRAVARAALATIVTNEHHRGRIEARGGRALIIRDIPTEFEVGPPPPLGDGFRVMAVSTFAPDEPVAELVAAARQLPGVSIHMTGDPNRPGFRLPPERPDNIHLTGFIPDDVYYGLMRASDAVLCLTTRDHTMQRGACEALSMGVPIITSDSTLLRSYFRMGTVHVRNDRDAIRRGIERMVEDHERYVAEIRELQKSQRDEWDDALAALLSLLR
jgi:glycosyltransferase involved in cell wall biosynthesis